MTRPAWISMGFAVGLALGPVAASSGQGLLPPPPGVNLEQVSRQMALALQELHNDIAAGIGQSPGGPYLVRDTQELQRASGEWYASARGTTDPYQLRRSYSGIDGSWHRLRGQLSAPGVANPAILDEIRRVEQADAALHQALNLNAYPANFQGPGAPPTGLDETRRLAYTLAQRGEGLAAVIQAGYGQNPNAASIVNDSAELARMVDGLSDALSQANGPPPLDQVQQAFVPIVQKSNGLGITLDRSPMPPPLRAAWDAYTTVLNLTRTNLGLTGANIDFPNQSNIPLGPYVPVNPAPQVTQWADSLDRQVDELLAHFGPTAVSVPEGREMLGEMERLREDVHHFREDAVRQSEPGHLAHGFRAVDADWQRLARHMNRIARGRTGPNIQRVQQIGETCEQIHRVLGMPGYPPVIQPYQL